MKVQAPADTINIRYGLPADRRWVRHIESACFGRSRVWFGLWRRVGASDTFTYLLEVSGTPAGYLIAYLNELDDQQQMYVGGMGILPAYRQHSLGRRLLEALLTLHPSFWLHVRAGNQAALHIYRSLGMLEQQRILSFYHNGDDALVMVTPSLWPALRQNVLLRSAYEAG